MVGLKKIKNKICDVKWENVKVWNIARNVEKLHHIFLVEVLQKENVWSVKTNYHLNRKQRGFILLWRIYKMEKVKIIKIKGVTKMLPYDKFISEILDKQIPYEDLGEKEV